MKTELEPQDIIKSRNKPLDKEIKVILQYEDCEDAEDRLSRIYEFLFYDWISEINLDRDDI